MFDTSKINLSLSSLCVCEWVCMVGTWVTVHVLDFQVYVGSRDWTRVLRVAQQVLYQLSQPVGPSKDILKTVRRGNKSISCRLPGGAAAPLTPEPQNLSRQLNHPSWETRKKMFKIKQNKQKDIINRKATINKSLNLQNGEKSMKCKAPSLKKVIERNI